MKTTPLLLILAVILLSTALVGVFLFQTKDNGNADNAPEPTIEIEPVCIRSGCSGQLCVEQGGENGISTCEFNEEYACYSLAICEPQDNGECGWTLTEEYNICLAEIQAK